VYEMRKIIVHKSLSHWSSPHISPASHWPSRALASSPPDSQGQRHLLATLDLPCTAVPRRSGNKRVSRKLDAKAQIVQDHACPGRSSGICTVLLFLSSLFSPPTAPSLSLSDSSTLYRTHSRQNSLTCTLSVEGGAGARRFSGGLGGFLEVLSTSRDAAQYLPVRCQTVGRTRVAGLLYKKGGCSIQLHPSHP
jgi:hypothetical protein